PPDLVLPALHLIRVLPHIAYFEADRYRGRPTFSACRSSRSGQMKDRSRTAITLFATPRLILLVIEKDQPSVCRQRRRGKCEGEFRQIHLCEIRQRDLSIHRQSELCGKFCTPAEAAPHLHLRCGYHQCC